ncbi:DUF4190 domain-containing protein [Demequina mangrovi]|uniref:DUF4190 domain-containing protein n=1 Tax=Demequina mangrovi TaxID=1043493 RepID=A0A1H6ZT42_9MICO|nr:DUF4190 domain-containing protein [Demequina mangrovi]SEJ52852.1 protein of unknown function [Demequina mangrovi]
MTNPPQDPFAQEPPETPPSGTSGAQGAPTPQPEQPQQPPQQPPQPAQPAPGYTQAPPQQGYAQPGYAQPGYGAAPAYGPGSGTQKNWMGVTALILSLAGLFTGITAIGGIVFGHLSLAAAKRGEADNRGLGLAGLIIGYILVVLGIFALIAIFAFAGWFLNECGGDNPAEWCNVTIETTQGA